MYIITTKTICTECTPERAIKVVKAMRQRGIDVNYGDESILPQNGSDTAFTKAFYDALDEVDHGIIR